MRAMNAVTLDEVAAGIELIIIIAATIMTARRALPRRPAARMSRPAIHPPDR